MTFLLYNLLHLLVGLTATEAMTLATSSAVKSSFKFNTYIEYTDTFKMLFNSNYPMLVERAVNHQLTTTEVDDNHDIDKHNGYVTCGYRMTAAKTMKFKKKASLGDQLEFTLKEKSHKSNANAASTLQYDISCNRVHNDSDNDNDNDNIFQCNKAIFQLNNQFFNSLSLVKKKPNFLPSTHIHKSTFDIYSDELQIFTDNQNERETTNQINAALSTKTIFNLFERSRTDVLGGPKKLAETADTSFHIYVARISDYQMFNHQCCVMTKSGLIIPSTVACQVLSQIELVGDSLMNFHQQIVLFDKRPYKSIIPAVSSSEEDRLDNDNDTDTDIDTVSVVAQAMVTCMCVDATTGDPATFSQEIKELLKP